MDECRSCNAKIKWVTLENGKSMPLDPRKIKVILVDDDDTGQMTDAYISHFATCPHASINKKKMHSKSSR
jgi:hypothetical protein